MAKALKQRPRTKRGVIKKKKTTSTRVRRVGRALTQGVGSVPRKVFGSNGKAYSIRQALRALDATSPCHLALPRATGPYTVVKTTNTVRTAAQFGFACTFAKNMTSNIGAYDHPAWLNVTWMEEAIVGAINAASGTRVFVTPGFQNMGENVTLVPSAITMQVMCPKAVTEANGIVYIGRSHSQFDLEGTSKTWSQLGEEFVSYMAPRLCSGGKLALRGVKVSGYPMDMSALADFRGADIYSDGTITWASPLGVAPEGMSPLCIYNPSNLDLELLITTEWRARFGIGEVAASTHTFHEPSTDSLWARACQTAQSTGHGVVDIAEDVAEMGAAAGAYAAMAA